jgi:hypothetical protein
VVTNTALHHQAARGDPHSHTPATDAVVPLTCLPRVRGRQHHLHPLSGTSLAQVGLMRLGATCAPHQWRTGHVPEPDDLMYGGDVPGSCHHARHRSRRLLQGEHHRLPQPSEERLSHAYSGRRQAATFLTVAGVLLQLHHGFPASDRDERPCADFESVHIPPGDHPTIVPFTCHSTGPPGAPLGSSSPHTRAEP